MIGPSCICAYIDEIDNPYPFLSIFWKNELSCPLAGQSAFGTPPIPRQAIVRRPDNEHLATIGKLLEDKGFATYFDVPGTPKRFFVHIMTTSSHRPYTYPDGRIDIPSPGGRDGAVKYTDFAIGQFLDKVRQSRWFDDTLFVIVADHCASVAGKAELPVAKYHIPLIFYGPRLVRPGRVTRLISQIDIAPTLMDALGMEGDDHFFDKAIHEQGHTPKRAFISNYQSLGYYKRNILTVLKPKRKIESYAIDPATLEAKPTPIDELLRDEAIAYYQTTARAFKLRKLKEPGY